MSCKPCCAWITEAALTLFSVYGIVNHNQEREKYMLYDNEVMISTQGMYNNAKSNFAGEDVYYGPTNTKNDPCSTCPMMKECENNVTDCVAMRSWYNTGDFWNKAGWSYKNVYKTVTDTKGKKKKVIVINKETKKPVMEKYWKLSDVGKNIKKAA